MHFKAPDNSLHSLSEEDILKGGRALLPIGSVAISDEEAEAIRKANQPVVGPIAVEPQIDPVEKLRAFLAANPDVSAIL